MSGEQNYRRVLRELEAQLDGTAHNAALQEDTKATLWQLITVLQTDVKKLEQIVAMQNELIELKDARLQEQRSHIDQLMQSINGLADRVTS